ncbi:MAG: type II toxin-antitoxin system PemK/MazF family toxin [Candidatus Thioglobus sp.]|nr:type II toxin-antitoxin system PemK/MazF family toxin [Candidatus Thioglobus sp.]
MNLNKGDIYLVDFDPAKVGEIGKLRPAVILSDNQDTTLFETVVVVPLSSVIIENNIPYRYFISNRGKLKKGSDACIYEIRSLSKSRIKTKLAAVTANELADIHQALCELL